METQLEIQKHQYDAKITQWENEVEATRIQNQTLQLQLAEYVGEVKAMTTYQENLTKELEAKEAEIDKISNQSLSQQEQMNLALQVKVGELEKKEQEINAIKAAVEERDNIIKGLLFDMEQSLQSYSSEDIAYEIRDARLHIILSESLIFRSEESIRIISKGREVLEKMATVMEQYPSILATVIGHTDNEKPRRYSSNWNFSVDRATAVVKTLADDIGFSPNQLIVAGKGEFEPRASNATSGGRSANRRVEIVISIPLDGVYRLIRG